ncbi:hypothetical protein V2P20_09225 [Methylobacter sp. Wu1]|uniref:hypothetical protein n=1 Tax=Methylobacter sp. Wu1 TaxID=3119359 RepID=UPI002F9502C8
MKKYRVILHFKGDFDYEETVLAANKSDAEAEAFKRARNLGWRKPVKKAEVLEAA